MNSLRNWWRLFKLIHHNQQKATEGSSMNNQCNLCKNPGHTRAVEKVPGGGILYECSHKDGSVCEWARFEGGIDSFKNIKADREISPEIQCPQCGSKGIIKTVRRESNRPDRYSYRISHPDGSRCWVNNKNRSIILKALDRYIEPNQSTTVETQEESSKQSKKYEIQKVKREYHFRPIVNCFRCGKPGSIANYKSTGKGFIHRDGPKKIYHYVKTPKHKREFDELMKMLEYIQSVECGVDGIKKIFGIESAK